VPQVPYSEIASRTLVFNIYDFDRFSKHDHIGQLKVPLNSIDLGRVVEEWRDIQPPDSSEDKVTHFAHDLVSMLTAGKLLRGSAFVVAAWRSGNGVGCINEVTLRRAWLVLGWVT